MQVEFIHLFNNEMHTTLGHPLGYQLRKEQDFYTSRHLDPILTKPPKPPSQAEMDALPAWEDSGELP